MITTFLATVFGWYLVVFSLFLLFKREEFKLVMTDVLAQRGLFFVFAIITVIMGLLLVVSHNIWIIGWPVVITLLSWLILITGLIRLFFNETASKMATSFLNHSASIPITAVVLLIIGIFLLFKIYIH